MMVNQQNSASENRAEDQNDFFFGRFFAFAISNGVLAALVLACISLGIVVAVKSPDNDIFVFYRIGFILDLGAVIIGFIAVAKRNESAWMVVLLLVSSFVVITDVMYAWIYCITTWTSNVSVNQISNINDKEIKNVLIGLNISRMIGFVVITIFGAMLKADIGRVRFMTNRTTDGPQNQEGTVELGNKELFGHRTIIHQCQFVHYLKVKWSREMVHYCQVVP